LRSARQRRRAGGAPQAPANKSLEISIFMKEAGKSHRTWKNAAPLLSRGATSISTPHLPLTAILLLFALCRPPRCALYCTFCRRNSIQQITSARRFALHLCASRAFATTSPALARTRFTPLRLPFERRHGTRSTANAPPRWRAVAPRHATARLPFTARFRAATAAACYTRDVLTPRRAAALSLRAERAARRRALRRASATCAPCAYCAWRSCCAAWRRARVYLHIWTW